jgi:hypothetical protein
VVRHNLVQQIIRAYEEYDGSQAQRSGSGGNGKSDARSESRGEPGKEPTKDFLRG